MNPLYPDARMGKVPVSETHAIPAIETKAPRTPAKRAKAGSSARALAYKLQPLLTDPERVLFLDIETTGLSKYYDELTLVGYAIAGTYRVHVAGDDPKPLRKALSDAKALVTFNGTLFDVPFLKKTFDEMPLPLHHVDLRYSTRAVGLTGGQKSIELQLGISVRSGLDDVDGRVAVLLWHEYLRGSSDALRRLIAYNRADVLGMTEILDHVYSRCGWHADLFICPPRFSTLIRNFDGHAKAKARLPSPKRLGRRFTTFNDLFLGTPTADATIVGIDLTGSEARPSGFCVLSGRRCDTKMLASDDEILAETIGSNPLLVSIDSPLSLPSGRTRVTDDDPGRNQFGIMRQCERTLKKRGINVYPCLLPSMQRLTERGMRLAQHLRTMGIPVIESYPGAAQDIMGIPRKGAGEALLRVGLANFGLTGAFLSEPVKHDELDAITSALVGSFFFAGKFEALRAPNEGALIVPHLSPPSMPFVIGISGSIGTGKTTAARIIESTGFTYSRFSQVIDEEIVEQGLVPDRETRQTFGWKMHQEKGQRWLCERVLELVAGAEYVVIDGLRFPEDRAYFFEQFSAQFIHLHMQAPEALRRARLRSQGVSEVQFTTAAAQPTEALVDQLAHLASATIDNVDSIYALHNYLLNLLSLLPKNAKASQQPI